MKKFHIFSGAGDPTHPRYASTFALVSQYAVSLGYSQTIIHSYPGQFSNSNSSSTHLSIDTAIDYLKNSDEFAKLEGDIYCRSYGCSVFMTALSQGLIPLDNISSVCLWGPTDPYRLFELDQDLVNQKPIFIKKNVRINEATFRDMIPFSILFKSYILNQRKVENLVIATGENDNYCSPAYLKYLGEHFISNKKKNIKINVVRNAEHVVNLESEVELKTEYLEKIFDGFSATL